MSRKLRLVHVAVLSAGFYATPAIPQVPPHYPGTLCLTPYFWCPLPGALQPGSRCYCPGPYGPVYGQAG